VLGEEGLAAEDLEDFDDGTPSRTADSVAATAGTSARRTNGLLDSLSRRIVPSCLGWSGRGAIRSDPVALRHAPQHSRGGSRSTRSVDRVPDSMGVPTHPQMYETPRNMGVPPQGQIRHEGAYATPPETLFSVPLGTAEGMVYANPTFTVPVSVERDFYGINVVQVSGPIASQSGAGFVGAEQSVPVPTGRTDAAAASAGVSASGPVQTEFLTGRQSTDLEHSAPNRPIQTGTEGLVFTTTAPMVSVGTGASVGVRHPASKPVDKSGPGMAGVVPYAVSSLVNGGYGSPVVGSAVPSALGGAVPTAGFPESAGAPPGVPGLARGTCPINGSRIPAPPGNGATGPDRPGAEVGTALCRRAVTSENGCVRTLVVQRLAELERPERGDPKGRYLPSLAISAVPSDGLTHAFVRPVTEGQGPASKSAFSRAYVNCEFRGRPLACMLDTGCDRSVIGR